MINVILKVPLINLINNIIVYLPRSGDNVLDPNTNLDVIYLKKNLLSALYIICIRIPNMIADQYLK